MRNSTLVLPATPPFNLYSVVHSHGWYQLAPFSFESGLLETMVQLQSGKVVRVAVRQEGEGVAAAVDGDPGVREIREVQSMITWMMDLDLDLQEFYELAEEEPALKDVRAGAKGRLLRSPTVFEDVVKTILTTNTSWAGTKRMVSNLVELYGEPMETVEGDQGPSAFPAAAALASLSEEELRTQARLGYRAPYVSGIARAEAEGELDLESLKHTDLDSADLYEFFLSLKGVGPYAAAHLILLLGHYDRIPVDSWARKLVSVEWYDGEPVTEKEVQEKFAGWGKWKALAFWLWDWKHVQALQDV